MPVDLYPLCILGGSQVISMGGDPFFVASQPMVRFGLTNAATGLNSTLWRSAQKGLSLHKQPYIEELALLPGRYR